MASCSFNSVLRKQLRVFTSRAHVRERRMCALRAQRDRIFGVVRNCVHPDRDCRLALIIVPGAQGVELAGIHCEVAKVDVAVSTSLDQTLDDDAHGANANRRKLMEGSLASWTALERDRSRSKEGGT